MHGFTTIWFLYLTLQFVCANDHDESSPTNMTFQITARFTRMSLEQYLKTKPDLWKSKKTTKKHRIGHYASNSLSSHQDELETVAPYSNKTARRQLKKQAIPSYFDARQKWANCRSIKTVLDQSRCANCWAFAAAGVFSDRICIASKGKHQVQISSTDLTNCCENCFSPGSRNGCTGGYPLKAWKHLIKHGAVTGSSYRDHSGCIPYEFPSCNQDAETHTIDEGCQHDGYQTGQCRTQCQSGHYRPYNKDKYYARQIVHPKTIHEIQLELMEHGPLEMRMHAFEDLINYSSGIYYHRYGGSIGTHSVRLVGWGEQDGVPYWLIANSWNSAWGIENGFFKIVRGTNHCGIESEILAGSVDLKRLPH